MRQRMFVEPRFLLHAGADNGGNSCHRIGRIGADIRDELTPGHDPGPSRRCVCRDGRHLTAKVDGASMDEGHMGIGLQEIGRAFRELIGDYDIAMSAVQVVALIEDEAKVEIEATAVIPQ